MVELEDREVEEEDVSPEDWFLELQPEQRARARKLFNGKSPISEILAGRVSLSSDTASSVTAQTNNSEKLWLKKKG
jgi:plasmid maintenance system antidote protein VapI